MKAISPSSYQKIFQITPGTGTVDYHRGLFLVCTATANSIGLKFYDDTGVTLYNMGTIGTTNILPVIAKQVISASGLTAYGML